MTASIP
ncbi:putative translation initiation inhibitor, yjgF family [Caballeronia sordidicola]|nr:putative translation initiation inhibitor, yjgF family [Caballeronia sordidicola]